jgi:hypothetical protein
MELIPLDSSNLAAAGYDPATQVLRVQFKNGSIYDYSQVPPDIANGLFSADSAGQYLHQRIKGKYQHTLIQPAAAKQQAV